MLVLGYTLGCWWWWQRHWTGLDFLAVDAFRAFVNYRRRVRYEECNGSRQSSPVGLDGKYDKTGISEAKDAIQVSLHAWIYW